MRRTAVRRADGSAEERFATVEELLGQGLRATLEVMTIADEKYIAVQTFKRNGEAVNTACWITGLSGGRVGFWTSSDSFKYKRLKNDPRITIQASDVRGRPKAGAEVLTGTATIVADGADWDAIRAQITKKYGVMVPISKVMNVLGHLGKGKYRYGNVGVVVTLDGMPPR